MIHNLADADAGLALAYSCICDEQAVNEVRQSTLAFPRVFSILRSTLNSLLPAALNIAEVARLAFRLLYGTSARYDRRTILTPSASVSICILTGHNLL